MVLLVMQFTILEIEIFTIEEKPRHHNETNYYFKFVENINPDFTYMFIVTYNI